MTSSVAAAAVLIAIGLHGLTVDSAWQVMYGRDLISGNGFASGGPTPHPLLVWTSAVLELAGLEPAHRFEVWLLVASASLVLLVGVLAATLTASTASVACGIAAAIIVLSRPLVIALTTVGYYEMLYALLIVAAVCLLATKRLWRLAFALVLFAGTIRTEAWLLAPVVLIVTRWRGEPVGLTVAAACLIPPILWGLTDLGLSGQFLGSIFDTRAGAEALARERGIEALWLGPLRLTQAATTEIALAWVVSAVFVVRWRHRQPERAAVFFRLSGASAVIAALVVASSVAGASLLIRYFLVPGLLLSASIAVAALMARDQQSVSGKGTPFGPRSLFAVVAVALLVGVRADDLRDIRSPERPQLTGLVALSADLRPSCQHASIPVSDLVPYVALPAQIPASSVVVSIPRDSALFVPSVPIRGAGQVRAAGMPEVFRILEANRDWTVWADPAGKCSKPATP